MTETPYAKNFTYEQYNTMLLKRDAEIAKARTDISILLSQIEYLVEGNGEDLDIADRAIRHQIKADYEKATT